MRIGDIIPNANILPKENSSPVENIQQDFKQVLEKAVSSKEDKQLMDAAKQFEALFIYQMFERMRETAPGDGLLPKSMGEKIFQSMLDQQVSEKAAETGPIGLAEIIYKQLKTL